MKRRLCLITGASAGIGMAFARHYAELGWDLALTARRVERLEELAGLLRASCGVSVEVLAEDLSDPAAPARLIEALEARERQVDGLVNNAGYGVPGSFGMTGWSGHAAFLQVMLTAPLELAWRCLSGMTQRGYGRIINVASLAGYLPGGAGHTLYGAVKAGLIRFSESVAAECRMLGHEDVRCTALCPGLTWSEFHDVNATRDEMNRLPGWLWMEPEPVVASAVRAVNLGQPVCVPGLVNKTAATLSRVLPEPAVRALIVRMRGAAGSAGRPG